MVYKMIGAAAVAAAACFALASAQTATTATPPPPPDNAKAIRTLVYSFQEEAQGTWESHSSGIGSGYSHVASGITSGAWQGKVYFDVLGVATNGALNVRLTEEVEHDERKKPVFMCSTYPNMFASCVKHDDPNLDTTSEEEIVLEMLAPGFVDASHIDDNNHWKLTAQWDDLRRTTDWTVLANDNDVLQLEGKRTFEQLKRNHTGVSTLTATYDMKRVVPLAIDERYGESGSSYHLKMTLLSDTMAAKRQP